MSKSIISSSSGRPSNCVCDFQYKKRNKPKFDPTTTMKTAYQPYKIQKELPYQVPKVKKTHYDPDTLQTSYKLQYKQPDPNLSKYTNLLNSSYQYQPKKTPFYSETEYKKNFQPLQIKPEKQVAYIYKPRNIKFQGSTTYGTQFKPIKVQKSNLHSSQQILNYNVNNRPKIPFQGKTSYQQTFTKYDIKQQKQPQYKYQPKKTKFQGETNYKTSFQHYPESAYKSDLQYCPVHPQRVATKPKVKK